MGTTLKEQLSAARKAASDYIKGLEVDGHEITEDELAEARKKSDLVTELAGKVERQKGLSDLTAGLTGAVEDVPEGRPAKSLGEHFVKSVGETIARQKSEGRRVSAQSSEYKAATDVHITPGPLAPALLQVDTNIVTGVRRRLTVADLLGSETISGTALTYFVEGALEAGDFGIVAENGQKPQLHFGDPVAVTEALKKIAAFIKESDELGEDLPFLKSAIDGRLLYQLGLFEENQLLNGSGTGTNIRGLLNRSGIQTIASASVDANADTLFRAITATALNSGLDADGIIITPAVYQALRLSKDANGQYFGGGFFTGQYGNGTIQEQPPLWGLRTVVTPAIAAGTTLVGAFAQSGSVIRKGGVAVEATNTNEDDFTNNRITIRAEERLLLAVRRPSGLVKVTLGAAA